MTVIRRHVQIGGLSFVATDYHSAFSLLTCERSPTPLPWIAQQIYEQDFDFIADVIATDTEICLKWTSGFHDSYYQQMSPLNICVTRQVRKFCLPVWFTNSDDWRTVQDNSQLSKNQCLEQLQATELTVALFGFLPGFVYLRGLPESLHVPRKSTPATRVPADSFAVGGPYAGIYSLPSPGGWHILGNIAVSVSNLKAVPPISLQPGDKIRIQPVDQNTYHRLRKQGVTLEEFHG